MEPPLQGRQRLLRVGDITIEAFEFGTGEPTLILAAGNGRPAGQFDVLAAGLAEEGIAAVTYNYRGIGSSTGPIQGLTLHDLAADVWHVADQLDVERVHLAGKTFGNRVMRAAATSRPGRTASITLIGAGGQIAPSAETRALYRRYLDPDISTSEWTELHASLMYAPGNKALAASAAELGTFAAVAAAQIEASNATPPAEWTGGGSAPMLVLVGLHDRVAPPANGFEIAVTRANTSLVGLADCGHSMLDEQPETLRREIAGFINRNTHQA